MSEPTEPQGQPLPAWVNILRTAIEFGPKMAITVGAACYGVGLLVVSSHLAALGVYSTDLLRTEYVLAGAAFCVLTLCAAVASHYFIASVKHSFDLWKKKSRWRALFQLGVTVGGSPYLFTLALELISTPNFASYANWRMWLTLGIATFSYATARNVLRMFRQVWTTTLRNGDERVRMGHWWELVWNLIILFASIGVYTEQVYPHLLLQYGGGYAGAVFLLPTENGRRVAVLTGLPFQPDGSIGPVQLLLENDQGYTVATMGGARAVSVARDLVDGVVRYKTRYKVSGKGTVIPVLPRPLTPAPPGARSQRPPHA